MDAEEEVDEVPHFFICPISLQIMKDPVTAATGITYDRESIERWLFSDGNTTCPLTNQPLLPDLVPNHTLRRLIQAWCALHPSVDRIPTPRPPLDAPSAVNLLRDLSVPRRQLHTLSLISALAADSQSNRRCILNAGATGNLLRLIASTTKTNAAGEAALLLLHSLRVSPEEIKPYVSDFYEAIETLTRIMSDVSPTNSDTTSAAVHLLKAMFEVANPSLMERLKLGFFEAVILILRDRTSASSPAIKKAALQVLLLSCPVSRNRARMVEAGAVTELIELELAMSTTDKRTSELLLGVLDHLCTCAAGRAQLVEHAAGIALVSKRILKVSAAADERAVKVLVSVCRYSATAEVLQEMLRVGAVSKLCFVLQADCSSGVREKAMWVLKLHSGVWRNSPCVDVYP